ncbi:MAG: FHA domain-containing protein, partial [gamma proteobacterium symbiont of Bathyaustriella thionipta]|nr:FHA domain-containing protein [gamma proteobacterium symbiont of Bathyaustriella thionipta]
MPKLVVKLGELVEEYSLDKQQMEVGRDTGCDITLSDPSVSRRHAH